MRKLLSLLLGAALMASAAACPVFAEEETITSPQNIISQARSATAVSLSWDMSQVDSNNKGEKVSEYRVYEINGETETLVKTVEKTEVTRPGCVISDLEPGSTHTYKVMAVSDNGTESGFSEAKSFTTLESGVSADVALGKDVRSNSVGTDGFRNPGAAVNGMTNYTMRSNVWRSKSDANDKYLAVDLGKEYWLSHFIIKDAGTYGGTFKNAENIIIQGSNSASDYDGTTDNWLTIAHSYNRNNEAMFTTEKILTATVSAYRYVRAYFPANNKETVINLAEFEVYCAPADSITTKPGTPYIPSVSVAGTAAYIPIWGGDKAGDESVYTVYIGEKDSGAISTVADTVPCTYAIDKTWGNRSAHAVVTGLKPGKTYSVQVQMYDESRTQWSSRSVPKDIVVPSASGVNIALGRTAFTNKDRADRPVKCITDGNQTAATGIPYHYFNNLAANEDGYAGVDLGSKRAFNKVVVTWPAGRKADGYKIQGSNDYLNWTEIASEDNAVLGTGANVYTISFAEPQEYRYVRVYFPAGAAREIRLGEIEVYSVDEVLTGITAECENVLAGNSAEIKVSGTIESGRTAHMEEAVITYAADKADIVSINGNTVTGLKKGTANITVTANLYGRTQEITIPVSVNNDPSKFWVGEIVFTDQNSKEITAIDEETTDVETKVEFNPDNENRNYILFTAIYDGSVLKRVLKNECSFGEGEELVESSLSQKINLEEYGLKKGCKIKAFLFDSTNLLKPYCGAGKIEF